MQFADVLVDGAIEGQHLVPLFTQVTEGRQAGVGDEWHPTEFNVSSRNLVKRCRFPDPGWPRGLCGGDQGSLRFSHPYP
jgi:hypothetical protein